MQQDDTSKLHGSVVLQRTDNDTLVTFEGGGACSHTGHAVIVTGPQGEKKQALVVYTSGHLSNRIHALIPISVMDHIIEVQRNRGNRRIFVRCVDGLPIQEHQEHILQETTIIAKYTDGTWNTQPPDYLQEAIRVAIEKSETYHCRSAMWCLEPSKEVI